MKELFFKTGVWFGKGVLSLNFAEQPLPIWIRYEMTQGEGEGVIKGFMEYHIASGIEPVVNRYTFGAVFKDQFTVSIENEAWGKAAGLGFIHEKTVGFEFKRGVHGFEGYESYTFVDDKTFLLKTEFLTDEGLRSEITATVMRNVESPVMS